MPVPIQVTHLIRGAYNLSNFLLRKCLCRLIILALIPYTECNHGCAFTFPHAATAVPIGYLIPLIRHLLVLLPSVLGAVRGRSTASDQCSVPYRKKVQQVYRLFGVIVSKNGVIVPHGRENMLASTHELLSSRSCLHDSWTGLSQR